jgi:ABC-2 type transport system permease protein
VTGTWQLLRSFLRRDRFAIPAWSVGLALLYWSQAVSVEGLYTTQEEFDRAAASMESNAAFIAMAGPARALNTVGGQVVWQASAFGAVLAGLMSMFLLGRHTRAEEESGRDELVRSSVVGRRAPLAAAMLLVLLANLVAAALITLSLLSVPLATADSIATGLGMALCGLAFGGVALVAMQLTRSTRAAYGIAGAAIGLAYVLRAVGDVGQPVFRWLSPIGWYQSMHPFSGLRWWPALLLVGATLAVSAVAVQLFERRDIGSGLLADRPGPPRASERLSTAWGLSWRMQRGSVAGWAAGLLLGGLAFGSIGNDVGDLIGEGEVGQDMFAPVGDLVDGYYATSLMILALIASGFTISSVLRARGEEEGLRVEPLLATALSRQRWWVGHVSVTVVGTVVVLVAGGLGLGLGNALVTGDVGAVTRLSAPMLAQAAPVLVLGSVAQLLYGLVPRWAQATWVLLVLCFVVMLFGELLRLPQWLRDLSPFDHLALVPAEDFRWAPVLVVGAIALATSLVGQAAFTRRDVGA